MTEDQFREMCKDHDLTYSYSDDGRWYRAGCESFAKIKEASKLLPSGVARAIWNSVVDQKIVQGYRDSYYWRE